MVKIISSLFLNQFSLISTLDDATCRLDSTVKLANDVTHCSPGEREKQSFTDLRARIFQMYRRRNRGVHPEPDDKTAQEARSIGGWQQQGCKCSQYKHWTSFSATDCLAGEAQSCCWPWQAHETAQIQIRFCSSVYSYSVTSVLQAG